jgi:acetyltransferase-like isoleucine patch superfamily enzyme
MISSQAIIEDGVILGENVTVGHFTIIRSGTTIGNNVTIGSHCEIGFQSQSDNAGKLIIGDESLIRSHSIVYSNSTIGKKLTTGHRVTIREKSIIGNSVQIGTLGDIQGDCVIGDNTRMHSNVHIGKYSQVGSFVWIYPYVVLTNDPHPPSDVTRGVRVNDFAVIATMSVVLPGVEIGFGSLVGAHSLVTKNVLPETMVTGVPAKSLKNLNDIIHQGDGLPAYPWARHFVRGYPDGLLETYHQSQLGFIAPQ